MGLQPSVLSQVRAEDVCKVFEAVIQPASFRAPVTVPSNYRIAMKVGFLYVSFHTVLFLQK